MTARRRGEPDPATRAPDRPLPRLHAVTDDEVLAREGWTDAASALLAALGPAVALHVRGPSTAGRALHELVVALAPLARRSGGLLVINDRVDVARVAGAAGVQLPGRSMTPADARAVLGEDGLVGVSVHDAEGAVRAARGGADWALVGTMYPTASHPGLPGIGIEGLREASRRSGGLALVGIGGIGPERAADVVRAGAWGVAALRGVWSAPDPVAAARRYLTAIESVTDD